MAVESSGFIWIGDKLPTVYDASIQIFFLSPTPTSLQREHVVQKYCDSLVDVWQRSFGKEFVVNEKTVKRTLLSIMVAYDKRIKNRYGDQRIGKPVQSIRQVNKEWYRYCIEHISEFSPKEAKGRPKKGVQRQQPVPTSSTCLLDIGKNTANLTGDEKIFYEDQKNERRWTLSKEVDVEYEEERRKKFNEHVATQEREVMEESFQYPPDYEEDLSPSSSTALDRSARHAKRSGVNEVLCNNETKETQTPYIGDIDEMLFPRPDIRQSRNVSDNVKDAIATISYRAGVSVPKARVAFQAACEKAYNHQYYLTADEQKKFEPMLTDEVNDEEVQEPYAKVPRTTEDFRKYKSVLPSAKVVGEFKHNKALHQEIQAGKALTKLDEGTRVTFHFDTTSRSRIDGEWPSLILNFLNEDSDKCKVFYLRALFFAFEDREQIVKLFVETLKRLSVATGGVASPQHLWENIYSFMTDSVHKNLKIEYGVAEVLESDHIPHHVLCKAHVCEKLDGACLNALIQVETELKYPSLIIRRQPQLKSFVRQTKCIALAAIKAMLKLVSHEKSAAKVSLSKSFDLELEKDGVYKSMSLYKERRFTKLGYSAGAILDCVQQYERVLENTTCNNLLVQACRLYCESDYIRTALKALGYFTYRVTMPFLNCVERCDQNQLIVIIKQLYEDLLQGKMDTLVDYNVPWTHVKTEILEPSSPLDHLILNKMCNEAAAGLHTQCAGEYWEDSEKPRATQLHKLSHDERRLMATENLICERYLGGMGSLAAVSAAKSNKFFKGKRMRDDLVFDNKTAPTDEVMVLKTTKVVAKELNLMEMSWTAEQRVKLKEKIEEAVKKNTRTGNYRDLLLKKCKSHGGPVTSIEDVTYLVNKTDDKKKLKSSLRSEIGFQKVLHPFDAKERSYLYKMNFLSAEELAENLTILLDVTQNPDAAEDFELPSEEEMYEIICKDADSSGYPPENAAAVAIDDEVKPSFAALEPLAVIWDDSDLRYWCIGFYVRDIDD